MRTRFEFRALAVRGALLLSASAVALSAQVPNASAAATGLSGAFTARARGVDAIAWNPANLGLAGNPDFSLTMLAVSASSGLAPISVGDIAPFSGKNLPAAQRDQWLQTIKAKGAENGRVDGGITGLALSAGSLALSVSGSLAASTQIAPDAFEALMFGNAGRTGTVTDLSLKGSTVHVGAFTTAAASYGLGFGDRDTHFAIGVTGKYVLGNALAIAQDQGSSATSTGINVNFPAIFSQPDSDIVAGSGVGVDVGLAWTHKRFSFGASVQNVTNSFAWDETKLRSRTAMAVFNTGIDTSDFSYHPYATAPASLRAMVAEDKFKPVVSAGIAYALNGVTTFSADVRQRADDGIVIGPKTLVSGGLEFRGIPLLHLRGGAAYVTDGWGVSGGASLSLGPMDIALGASLRHIGGGTEPAVSLNVLSFR